MAAPFITNFGDEAHDPGETGLTIDGQDFGFFPGQAWMYATSSRTGAADQLTVGTWTEQQLTGVEIPASPNNAEGTVYLFVQNENLDWSFPYAFTLGTPVAPTITIMAKNRKMVLNLGTMMTT